ncbi:hypothetical protein CG709_04765 [Lachnotalea glycerini]|nr:hypothetical protein CG709_04765 [Lachnotalea glycerini]
MLIVLSSQTHDGFSNSLLRMAVKKSITDSIKVSTEQASSNVEVADESYIHALHSIIGKMKPSHLKRMYKLATYLYIYAE